MDGYAIARLKDMLDEIGEDRVKSMLSSFSCPLNPDLEYFLKRRAIEFSRQGIAPTYLVFASYKKEIKLIAYFTLTVKTFCVQRGSLSKNLKKKIAKFGTYDELNKGYMIPAPLIAQLGKNFQDGLNRLISGDELLKMAIERVAIVQEQIGGKVVYLECEDNAKLVQFYESNGFVTFGKREVDKEEAALMGGNYLLQMLKIIKH